MEYRHTGIVLNKRDVGETDRIYTMYSFEGGKIRSLAKGVRKPHAKLASSLENITLADITIVRTRGLGKITGSIVEHNFSALKRDCDAVMETFSALSLFDRIVDFENPDQATFILLKDYLEAMDGCASKKEVEKYAQLRLGFIVKLLDALGYSIEVSSCVSCRKPLTQETLCFSAQHGGALCADCARENSNCALPISINAIKMIRLFLQSKMGSLSKIQAERQDCDSARLAVDDFLRWNT